MTGGLQKIPNTTGIWCGREPTPFRHPDRRDRRAAPLSRHGIGILLQPGKSLTSRSNRKSANAPPPSSSADSTILDT